MRRIAIYRLVDMPAVEIPSAVHEEIAEALRKLGALDMLVRSDESPSVVIDIGAVALVVEQPAAPRPAEAKAR